MFFCNIFNNAWPQCFVADCKLLQAIFMFNIVRHLKERNLNMNNFQNLLEGRSDLSKYYFS